jgi:hypothetical protein
VSRDQRTQGQIKPARFVHFAAEDLNVSYLTFTSASPPRKAWVFIMMENGTPVPPRRNDAPILLKDVPQEDAPSQKKHGKKQRAGAKLEQVVARIQQMMDPNSVVTRNEKLVDRVGNEREFDVVIRGQFGGRPAIGVMECKDHSRKKGPDAVEAFAKKSENLGANLRIIVSKKGFTEQGLRLAKHENIGCLSLLPNDPKQCGFCIGDWWYGEIRRWENFQLAVNFDLPEAPTKTFDTASVKWDGKPVINWFLREFWTTHREAISEGSLAIRVPFDKVRSIEIGGVEYPVREIVCFATRVYRKKRKFISWTGDALVDWHSCTFAIPPQGLIVGSRVDSDISAWPDYDGHVPKPGEPHTSGLLRGVIYLGDEWDPKRDSEVPDLAALSSQASLIPPGCSEGLYTWVTNGTQKGFRRA